MTTYIVICRGDTPPESDTHGAYELATRTVFKTREAAEVYAQGIAGGRAALVVEGHFTQLRFGEDRGGWT